MIHRLLFYHLLYFYTKPDKEINFFLDNIRHIFLGQMNRIEYRLNSYISREKMFRINNDTHVWQWLGLDHENFVRRTQMT